MKYSRIQIDFISDGEPSISQDDLDNFVNRIRLMLNKKLEQTTTTYSIQVIGGKP